MIFYDESIGVASEATITNWEFESNTRIHVNANITVFARFVRNKSRCINDLFFIRNWKELTVSSNEIDRKYQTSENQVNFLTGWSLRIHRGEYLRRL